MFAFPLYKKVNTFLDLNFVVDNNMKTWTKLSERLKLIKQT